MSETFSKPVLLEARNIPTTISKDEIAKEKIWEIFLYIIDGDDAKDLDDAVYVKKHKWKL